MSAFNEFRFALLYAGLGTVSGGLGWDLAAWCWLIAAAASLARMFMVLGR